MDTDKLTKTEYAEYEERMNSLIKHNVVACKDEMGRSYWQFKGGPDVLSQLEDFHLQVMVELLDNRLS